MDIGKEYGTDKAKEVEGIWVEMGDGAEVLVARIYNKNHNEAIKRLTNKNKTLSRNRKLTEEMILDLTCQGFAEAVLLDWKGMKENGKNLPYSRENAYRILKQYPDFREDIALIAGRMENFKREDEEATAKN